jgi:hypothetical protein
MAMNARESENLFTKLKDVQISVGGDVEVKMDVKIKMWF